LPLTTLPTTTLLPLTTLPTTTLLPLTTLPPPSLTQVVWYYLLYQNAIVGLRRDPRGFQPAKTVLLDDVSLDDSLGGFSTGAFVAGDETSTRMIGSANAFVVSDGAVTLELVAGSPLEKEQWVAAVNECISYSQTAQVSASLSTPPHCNAHC